MRSDPAFALVFLVFGLAEDAPRILERRFRLRFLAVLAVEPGQLQLDIGDARRVAAGAALEHIDRGSEGTPRLRGLLQPIVDEAEIEQIVADEGMARAKPRLVDRDRLLDQWRGLGEAMRAQFGIGE